MNNQSIELTDSDWEEIILKLQAFTRSLVNKKTWFRKGSISKRNIKEGETKAITTYLKGKEIDDYVYGAIEKYLRNPEKFDPNRGTLINFLSKNLVRSLVSNDSFSFENRNTEDIYSYKDLSDDDENDSSYYVDKSLPIVEAFFDEDIDYQEIMSSIECQVKNDKFAEEIFLGINGYGLKRSEIIDEFGMSEKDYDNGMRRLKTILQNTAAEYDLKKLSL